MRGPTTLTAALLACTAGHMAAAEPQVRVDGGVITGASVDGVQQFLGIPYAAPPVGPLRWRAPQPVKAWRGARKAIGIGPDCMQVPFPSDAAPLGTTPAEDCLTINVWRPAAATSKRMPVLVWIFGGGEVNGGASPPVYSGRAFARDGVIFVSFNYRVGRFGWFGFPELTRQNADGGQLYN